MIIDLWPEDASDVPMKLRKYFSHASTLTVKMYLSYGVKQYWSQNLMAQVLQQLHNGHQGISKKFFGQRMSFIGQEWQRTLSEWTTAATPANIFRQDSVIYA